MSKQFMDFDAFFAESAQEANIEIKLFGKIYQIPFDAPASIILETYRLAEAGETEMSEEKQMQLAIGLLGEENVKEWCEKKITIRQLGEIMKWAMAGMTSPGEKEFKKNIQD